MPILKMIIQEGPSLAADNCSPAATASGRTEIFILDKQVGNHYTEKKRGREEVDFSGTDRKLPADERRTEKLFSNTSRSSAPNMEMA